MKHLHNKCIHMKIYLYVEILSLALGYSNGVGTRVMNFRIDARFSVRNTKSLVYTSHVSLVRTYGPVHRLKLRWFKLLMWLLFWFQFFPDC